MPSQDAHADVAEVLFDAETIAARVAALAREIEADYRDEAPLLIGVLKGAFPFCADLGRRLRLPVRFDFIAVSSYGDATRSSGAVRLLKDLDESVAGQRLLLVEDIVDTGLTLSYLLQMLRAREPADLRVCALLDKPSRRLVPVEVRYVGFTIPDRFVVGYGLDFRGYYRNLPYIAVLHPDRIGEAGELQEHG